MKCTYCNHKGFLLDLAESTQIVPADGRALMYHERRPYCWPCFCLITNQCVSCGEDNMVLYKDERCKSLLYVCNACRSKPCIHLADCLNNGCMTAEEFAIQCQMELFEN